MVNWKAYGRIAKRAARRYLNPRAVRGYINAAQNYGAAYTALKTFGSKKRRASGNGVTTQHDRSLQYVKKSMPKARKRKWRKFVKRVRAVELKDRGLQTVLMNNQFNFESTPGGQTFGECHLYSAQGLVGNDVGGVMVGRGCRDIMVALQNSAKAQAEYQTDFTSDQTLVDATRNVYYYYDRPNLLMQSAVMDITLTNASETGCELDVYHVVYRGTTKKSIYNGTLGDYLKWGLDDTMQAKYSSLDGADDPVSSYALAAKPTLETRGMTLFECGTGISRSGAKILKKVKYFIAPGNSITYQVRDPKNRVINPSRIDGKTFIWPGLTQTVCFIAKSVDTVGIANIQAKWTRTYKYTVEGEKTATISMFQNK